MNNRFESYALTGLVCSCLPPVRFAFVSILSLSQTAPNLARKSYVPATRLLEGPSSCV
jgi:hypothetical protein